MKHRATLIHILGFLLPCAVLFIVHYNALRTWFFMDDFAWLGLREEMYSPRAILAALFEPKAQGTVRVLSERVFFLVFSLVFGMKAGPFHYWVFLTQCGSLILANSIVRRLSGSVLAGIAAATFWALSHSTAVALAWLSSYNEILCGFCALAAFYCLIRFVETGERRYWIWQWVAYLIGFLALEVIVVYPAFALLYVLLTKREYWKRTLWLWIPAVAYTAMHFLLIPKDTSPAYKMRFDLGVIPILGRYAWNAVGPSQLSQYLTEMPGPMAFWVGLTIAIVLVMFAGVRVWKRDWLPLLGAGWFLFFLAPLLPLQQHVSDYYITIPSFGFAMLTGWAFSSAVRANWLFRVAAIAVAVPLVWCEVSEADAIEQWYRLHSGQMHMLLDGVTEIAHRRQAEAVLLAGVDDELYISGMLDDPFRLYGFRNVYLVPGGESAIHSVPREEITLRTDQDFADSLLAGGKTVVVAYDGRGVVDATDIYRALRQREVRLTVLNLTDPVAASHLGPGWFSIEDRFRWMAGRATARLDTPTSRDARLFVSMFCPQTLLDQAHGSLMLTAWVEDHAVGSRRLELGEQQLVFDQIPKELFEKKELEVRLEVNHTVEPSGDGRVLGVPIYSIALKRP